MLEVGDLVKISNYLTSLPMYGVIRCIGAEDASNDLLAGIELEEDYTDLLLARTELEDVDEDEDDNICFQHFTDGTHNGIRYFTCPQNQAVFVSLDHCEPDPRFQNEYLNLVEQFRELAVEAETNKAASNEAPRVDTSETENLKRELQEIKEKMKCPICWDSMKNIIFQCGHGTCQTCNSEINRCPVCREYIRKRTSIY